MKSSSDKNTGSQTPPDERSHQPTNDSDDDQTSDYYYDDSTGYEIYKDEEDDADEPSCR